MRHLVAHPISQSELCEHCSFLPPTPGPPSTRRPRPSSASDHLDPISTPPAPASSLAPAAPLARSQPTPTRPIPHKSSAPAACVLISAVGPLWALRVWATKLRRILRSSCPLPFPSPCPPGLQDASGFRFTSFAISSSASSSSSPPCSSLTFLVVMPQRRFSNATSTWIMTRLPSPIRKWNESRNDPNVRVIVYRMGWLTPAKVSPVPSKRGVCPPLTVKPGVVSAAKSATMSVIRRTKWTCAVLMARIIRACASCEGRLARTWSTLRSNTEANAVGRVALRAKQCQCEDRDRRCKWTAEARDDVRKIKIERERDLNKECGILCYCRKD